MMALKQPALLQGVDPRTGKVAVLPKREWDEIWAEHERRERRLGHAENLVLGLITAVVVALVLGTC